RKPPLKTRRILPAVAVLALTAGPSVPIVFAQPADEFGLFTPSLLLAQFETTTPAPAPAIPPEASRAAVSNAPGIPDARLIVPRPDPAPSQSTVREAQRQTPTADALLLQQALGAAAQDDWSRALSLSTQSSRRVVK